MQSHHQTKLPISDFYELFIALLAVISVILTLMEFTGSVPASHEPYAVINNVILIIFTIDYFTRLILSREKWQFVKHHIFDLLAIVPFNQVFSFFRLSRLFQVGRIFHVVRVLKLARLARFFQLTRLIGLIGKLNHYAKKFLHTNGLIYWFYISGAIIIMSAAMYAYSERVSFATSLWWAVVTVTTVGYGDISPTTIVGKLSAVLLMLIGIGFISMLTSSITTYFTRDSDKVTQADNSDKLDQLLRENSAMRAEIKQLRQEVHATNKNGQ
ncbi:ion transporter [Secundilactobacillus collinoides]|nr:ion transporter [Secundilactobacillus collinoides]